MTENYALPKISIVTPTYNQGNFIEETIVSVLGQGYPNLEYLIIDGGSTDNTVEIIKKYENLITYWVSEPDNGQSHAINKGLSIATGDILGWLNSDDLYLPLSLVRVAGLINIENAGIYFGNCMHFQEGINGLATRGSDVVNMSKNSMLKNVDFVIQPSSFWTRKTWEKVGKLREDLHFAFDWEWFLRAERQEIGFEPLAKCLSMYRIHAAHKTATGGNKRQREILSIYKEYDDRIADLYELLMNENRPDGGKWEIRAAGRLLRIFRKPSDEPNMLKFLHPKKYQNYSSKEIADCLSML